MTAAPAARTPTPFPLRLAGGLAVVEGVGFVAFGVGEVASLAGDRLVMGVTTAAFLSAYGGFLAWCGVLLVRRHAWSRSPVVLAQLIQLGVAWGFAGGSTVWVAALLAVVAAVVLVGVFHPASLAALEQEELGQDELEPEE